MKNKKLSIASILSGVRDNSYKSGNGKGKAGKNGSAFESVVHSLNDLGFKLFENSEVEKMEDDEKPLRYIAHDVPYNSLLKQKSDEYGIPKRNGKSRTEFVIVAKNAISTPEFPTNGPLTIRIECKWQEVSGTTSNKLMLTVADLQYGPPEKNIILLMDGNGFDETTHQLVQEWCEDGIHWKRAPKSEPKNIRKMKLEEFINWANRAFME